MNCEKYPALIDDLVEGDLNYQAASRVYSHISMCRECEFLYETLKREREIYEQYFEIRTSTDLWTPFQSKLKAAETKNSVKTRGKLASVFNGKLDMLKHLRLTTVIAGAVFLFIIGISFGLSNFLSDDTFTENTLLTVTELQNPSMADTNFVETVEDNAKTPRENSEIYIDEHSRIEQKISESRFSNKRITAAAKVQKIAERESDAAKQFTIAKKVSAKPVGLKGKRLTPLLNAKNFESEDKGDFYALPFAEVSGETKEEMQILRVELPRSSLIALGVNLPVENAEANIKTDLLVSSDGIAKAIRLRK